MNSVAYTNVFFTYLDVLGFKDLIERNDHDVLDKIFDQRILGFFNKLADHEAERSSFDNDSSGVDFLSVSDSLMLWTENTSPRSFFRLINHTKSVMVSCLCYGIPLRGAISFGPLTIKRGRGQTIIIGKALTKAYTLENKQDWSGCFIDRECFEIAPGRLESMVNSNHITEYYVPFKSGPIRTEIAIDWVNYSHKNVINTDINEEVIYKAFSAYNKNANDWSVQQKINNTIFFYKELCKKFGS